MQRKIIKQGVGGYTIYLPAKWIQKNKLDKGDIISLEELDGNIILKAGTKAKEIKETKLRITHNTESSIRTLLTNAYRLGYHRLEVVYEQTDSYNIIKESISQLMGFEIISNKDNLCIIESLSEPEMAKAEQIFLKFLFLIEELFEHVGKLLDNVVEDFDYLQEVQNRIKRYDNFCRRVVLQQSKTEQLTSLKWIFYNNLMHAQRELYLLAKYQHKEHIKISKDVKDYFKQLHDLFEILKKAYMKKDVLRLEEIHTLEKKLVEKEAYDLMKKTKGAESIILHRLTTTTRKFYLCTSPLMGLFLIEEARA